jgi:PAS domain S-box-containing protein
MSVHSATIELPLGPPPRTREEEMRALLALSRDIAAAQDEGALASALARGLEALFPRRCFCVRFLDPKTLALTSLNAHGRLRPHARDRVALRRHAVEKTGLCEEQLAARGLAVGDRDEPVFEGCDRATAVPLAVAGTLFGVVHLEYEVGVPGDPQTDEPLLIQIANQAALGVRNLRSLEEVTHLKRYLEDLIENANALICVANREARVLVFNGALRRLVGVTAEQALGRDLRDFIAPDERPMVNAVMARALEGEPVSNVETRLLVRDGREARIAYSTSSIYGASGEVEGLIAIGQDLTLLRQLEQNAERAARLAELGQLAAGIVHELNNPLTAVTVYSESLHEKFSHRGAEPGDLEKLRTIRDAGDRLLRFSRDLMTYARPAPERLEEVDFPALVQKAAAMCEPVLRRSKAQVRCRLEPVPRLYGVRGSLLQVMVNLLTNAAQAMPIGGGSIAVELEPDGEGVRLAVADDGVGMAPDVARRAFEPFFTTKPPEHGTGLGLSIAQRIVIRHGGTISVQSALGEGTRFTVNLPLRPPA